MSTDTLEEYVRQYIDSQPGPEISFTWQGGEPTLMGLDFFREVVDLQSEYAPADTRVVNAIQTKGTLLDDEWCEFLADEEFLVGISLDGPRPLHDRYRTTRTGDPTFDEVMRGLGLLQEHGVEHNVLCVLNDCNSQYPLEVYEFFKRQGVDPVA